LKEQGASSEVVGDGVLGFVGSEFNGARTCPDPEATRDLREVGNALISEVQVATELRADVPVLAMTAALGLEVSEDKASVVLVAEHAVEGSADGMTRVDETHFDGDRFPAGPHDVVDEGIDPFGVIAWITGVTVEEEVFKSGVDGVAAWFPDVFGGHDPSELGVGLVVDDLSDRVLDPGTAVAIAV